MYSCIYAYVRICILTYSYIPSNLSVSSVCSVFKIYLEFRSQIQHFFPACFYTSSCPEKFSGYHKCY